MPSTIIVYNGPPSEPIKRDVLIFPNGTVWYANDVTDEDFAAFREKCKFTVRTILETLENGDLIIEADVSGF